MGKEGLLGRLRGMFAFVIFDRTKKTLFGARDHFGIKPFYYYHKDGTFLFGSEIKSFLAHPDFQKELFEEKLPDFMTFGCIPGAETFFRNVYKLLPGHYFTYEEGRLTVAPTGSRPLISMRIKPSRVWRTSWTVCWRIL